MDKFGLGEKIVKLRYEKGITQEQLANILDVSAKTVSKWETGINQLTLDMLYKISEVFNVSIEELLGLKKVKKHHSKINKDGNYRELIDVILVAISLASGICLVVTAILKEIDFYSAFALVGLGISCVSAYLLRKIK